MARTKKLTHPYTPRHHYTPEELDASVLKDLKSDAEFAEEQAERGPFFPEKGINKESLLAYAAECRAKMARYANGGAHIAVLKVFRTRESLK
jgi:hypothetical protein